jgi:hypothetical protein
MPTQVKRKPPKHWVFSRGRKDSMKKAQIVHVILLNIGKKYRNKEAHMFKAVPKSIRAAKRK